MVQSRHNALIWLLLVLLPALWIGIGVAHDAQLEEVPNDQVDEMPPPLLSPITSIQGRLIFLMGGEALSEPDPLGTRPMSQLAAAILLAQAHHADEAQEQFSKACAATYDAPEPDLANAVHAVIEAFALKKHSPAEPVAVTSEQWSILESRLEWFGQMAKAQLTGDANATQELDARSGALLLTILAAGGWFLMAGLAGLVCIVVLGWLAFTGRITSSIHADRSVRAVLGETFLVWMILFLGLRWAASALLVSDEPDAMQMWLSVVLSFASLASLAWARWRGVTWSSLRKAAGIQFSGGLLRLAGLSSISYATALPCMAVGVAIGQFLSTILEGQNFQDMSHPVQEMLPSAGLPLLIALFFVATVAAPIVEEIVFRGLLYGHVRQQTWKWPKWLSIMAAMLFSATLFAAIHPQGVLAVPALAGVSIGFCITREWSGSVVPGMVAHGFHNGVLLALNLLLNA